MISKMVKPIQGQYYDLATPERKRKQFRLQNYGKMGSVLNFQRHHVQNRFCFVWQLNEKYYEPKKAVSLSRSICAWCGLTIRVNTNLEIQVSVVLLSRQVGTNLSVDPVRFHVPLISVKHELLGHVVTVVDVYCLRVVRPRTEDQVTPLLIVWEPRTFKTVFDVYKISLSNVYLVCLLSIL